MKECIFVATDMLAFSSLCHKTPAWHFIAYVIKLRFIILFYVYIMMKHNVFANKIWFVAPNWWRKNNHGPAILQKAFRYVFAGRQMHCIPILDLCCLVIGIPLPTESTCLRRHFKKYIKNRFFKVIVKNNIDM